MTNSEMKETCKKMLEEILANDNPIAAKQCLVDDYIELLKKIPKEELSEEFNQFLYQKIEVAQKEKGFHWLKDVDLLTKLATGVI